MANYFSEMHDDYCDADITALNRAFREVMSVYYPGLPSYGQALEWQDDHSLTIIDHIGEQIKSAYDDGKRGADIHTVFDR